LDDGVSRPAGPRGGHDDAGLIVGGIAAAVLVLASGAWLPVVLTRPPGYTGGGPIQVAAAVLRGDITWTTTCTLIAVAEVSVLVLLAVGGTAAWRWTRRRRTRVDPAARRMASRKDLAHLGPKGVADSGRRLRPSLADVDRPDPDQLGVLIGTTVAGGMPLRQSWEDMAVDIWGPRTGKTTSRAIPAIVAAPGPTLVTSVKGDIVDATRDIRAARGTVWAFDPQHILGDQQGMWWNPLRAVATITDARRLAEQWHGELRDIVRLAAPLADPQTPLPLIVGVSPGITAAARGFPTSTRQALPRQPAVRDAESTPPRASREVSRGEEPGR
jgi:hypothetical protein